MPKPFYITTALPYVNAKPHMGHASEFIRADAIARFKKSSGFEVFFNTGTDEHGQKIYDTALQLKLTPQAYVDDMASKFKEILPALGISEDIRFTRTTDAHHMKAAQEFWRIVDKNGYIYKKNYSIKYCVGCELEKTESELVNGHCPLHPLQELELIEEENYFFKFSAFQKQLLALYDKGDKAKLPFVIPESRQKEIRAFVERGPQDFSISRLKTKMPWGVAVPGDDSQVMYVWFDALVNYVSAVGWPDDVVSGPEGAFKVPGSFQKWCVETGGMVQYCGKDNLRQQSAMWQAMLMAAGLPSSQTVIVDGFVTADGGVKMSKSLGNVIDPLALIAEFGTDAMRYYCLRELHPFEDSPATVERFKDAYNSNLANGLGNLVSRVMKMASANLEKSPVLESDDATTTNVVAATDPVSPFPADFTAAMERYDIQSACHIIWKQIAEADGLIQEKKPFSLIKTDKAAGQAVIADLCTRLYAIAQMLSPIMPATATKIKELVRSNKMPDAPLFLRK